MNYERILDESLFPTYERLKSGLLRLIDEGKISQEDAARLLPELRESEDERIRSIQELMALGLKKDNGLSFCFRTYHLCVFLMTVHYILAGFSGV